MVDWKISLLMMFYIRHIQTEMWPYSNRHSVDMGHSASKSPKINKDHNKQNMFTVGISVGRNNLNLKGHLQMGYNSKTIKNTKLLKAIENYQPVDAQNETAESIQNVEE